MKAEALSAKNVLRVEMLQEYAMAMQMVQLGE